MRRVLLLVGLWLCLTAGNCVPQQEVVLFENPSEQYLNMTGVIDEGLEYVVRVIYVQNARASGCPTYGKDSDLCQTKPEEFTYIPQIEGNTHRVHIPLKELSPGANSWWEPWDIAICVGPRDPNAVPHQCQRLFYFTEDTHDGHQTIDLVCTQQFWCFEGLQVENVSEVNQEYVVNIRKKQQLKSQNTTTIVELDQLLRDENWAAFIDRVLADFEEEDTITLLMAANMAVHEQRPNDAMLLYHVGTIRAQVDGKHYTPLKKDGESPALAIQNLIDLTQSEMRAFLPAELLQMYQAVVPHLKQWNSHYTNMYDPGWKSEAVLNLQDVQMYFEEAKTKRIHDLQGFMTLFENETYAEAYEVAWMYEWDPTLDQLAEAKRKAEETMQRIETQLDIDGFMAPISKQRRFG